MRADARFGALAAAALLAGSATAAMGEEPAQAALEARCAGSSVIATLTAAPGTRVRSVIFVIAPAGVDTDDRTEPFEAEFGQDYQTAARVTVGVSVELVGGGTEEHEQRLARCPKRFAKRPALRSTIVEGLSMGGVEIGMFKGEAEEQWGTPRSTACRGSSGAAPPGSPTSRFGGQSCDWDIALTAGGVSSGLISALFGVRLEPGRRESRVEELTVHRTRGSSRSTGAGGPRGASASAPSAPRSCGRTGGGSVASPSGPASSRETSTPTTSSRCAAARGGSRSSTSRWPVRAGTRRRHLRPWAIASRRSRSFRPRVSARCTGSKRGEVGGRRRATPSARWVRLPEALDLETGAPVAPALTL